MADEPTIRIDQLSESNAGQQTPKPKSLPPRTFTTSTRASKREPPTYRGQNTQKVGPPREQDWDAAKKSLEPAFNSQ